MFKGKKKLLPPLESNNDFVWFYRVAPDDIKVILQDSGSYYINNKELKHYMSKYGSNLNLDLFVDYVHNFRFVEYNIVKDTYTIPSREVITWLKNYGTQLENLYRNV